MKILNFTSLQTKPERKKQTVELRCKKYSAINSISFFHDDGIFPAMQFINYSIQLKTSGKILRKNEASVKFFCI